ncbi:MAG: septum formation initiator family protein [Clostridia bacterium]|nr:septum formation initiator family protein [Clostridia bacterium]
MKQLIQIFLIAVFAVCLMNFVVKKIDIAKKDAEIDAITQQIRDQKLKNGELEDILSEENEEDFYRNQAEDNLGYGYPNEKIYQDITGY